MLWGWSAWVADQPWSVSRCAELSCLGDGFAQVASDLFGPLPLARESLFEVVENGQHGVGVAALEDPGDELMGVVCPAECGGDLAVSGVGPVGGGRQDGDHLLRGRLVRGAGR